MARIDCAFDDCQFWTNNRCTASKERSQRRSVNIEAGEIGRIRKTNEEESAVRVSPLRLENDKAK